MQCKQSSELRVEFKVCISFILCLGVLVNYTGTCTCTMIGTIQIGKRPVQGKLTGSNLWVTKAKDKW